MAKGKKGERTSRPSAIPGIGVLVSPESFLKKCAELLREPFGAHIQFMPLKSSRGELYCFAKDPAEYAEESKLSMAPMRVSAVPNTSHRFWLAVATRLSNFGKEHYLEHVSIKIYTGRHGDPVKILRIRAEWDLRADDSAGHAQPHWHVHSVDDMLGTTEATNNDPVDLEALLALGREWNDSSLEDSLRNQDPNQGEMSKPSDQAMPDQDKLHLAMVSGWHLDSDPGCVNITDDQGICRWIRGVAVYLIRQLQFVASKKSSGADGE